MKIEMPITLNRDLPTVNYLGFIFSYLDQKADQFQFDSQGKMILKADSPFELRLDFSDFKNKCWNWFKDKNPATSILNLNIDDRDTLYHLSSAVYYLLTEEKTSFNKGEQDFINFHKMMLVYITKQQ